MFTQESSIVVLLPEPYGKSLDDIGADRDDDSGSFEIHYF
jgi:hypothetical protein